MIKIAARTLDIYDDDEHKIARRLPAELHQLHVAARDEVEELPDRCFGLVMKTAQGLRRRFPLHTEDSLKLSQAYFHQVRDELPLEIQETVEQKLAAVTEWFEADEDARDEMREAYNKVAYVDLTTLEPPRKVAHSEKAWGLTLEGKNHFPLHDETLVKTAIARFPFTREGLAPEQAFLYARNIEKRAQNLGVEAPLDSAINLYTNPGLNTHYLSVALEQRKVAAASLGIDTTVLDQVAVLAGCDLEPGALERTASFQSRQIKQAQAQKIDPERIVGVLQTFDKLAGFGRRDYLRGMADPFAACFKLAAYPSDGAVVDGVDLSKVDPNALAERFDEDFVQEFMENPATVYKSLPSPVRSVIRGMAEEGMGAPAHRSSNTSSGDSGSGSVGSAGDPLHRLNPVYANGNVLID